MQTQTEDLRMLRFPFLKRLKTVQQRFELMRFIQPLCQFFYLLHACLEKKRGITRFFLDIRGKQRLHYATKKLMKPNVNSSIGAGGKYVSR